MQLAFFYSAMEQDKLQKLVCLGNPIQVAVNIYHSASQIMTDLDVLQKTEINTWSNIKQWLQHYTVPPTNQCEAPLLIVTCFMLGNEICTLFGNVISSVIFYFFQDFSKKKMEIWHSCDNQMFLAKSKLLLSGLEQLWKNNNYYRKCIGRFYINSCIIKSLQFMWNVRINFDTTDKNEEQTTGTFKRNHHSFGIDQHSSSR